MHQRTIGDLTTSAIGIGELRLATAAARGISAGELELVLHHALDRGLTFVDVADEADAERMCGEAVRVLRLRDTAIVATRVPAIDAHVPSHRDALPEHLPPRHVQERIEASLRATKLDALPLAMLPLRLPWIASPAWPELAGTLARLVREGKVRGWGARLDLGAAERDGRLADELAEAARLREPFCALSIVVSACDRRGLPLVEGNLAGAPTRPPPSPPTRPAGLILSLSDVAGDPLLAGLAPSTSTEPALPGRPLPILAREPLAGGTLAGAFGPGVKLTPRDDRNAIDAPTLERIAVAIAELAALVRDAPPAARSSDAARGVLERAAVARREHVEATTLAELSLRFLLDRGAIVLPRLHRREHVATALRVMVAGPLSAAVHERIDRTLDLHGGSPRDQNSGGGTKPRTA